MIDLTKIHVDLDIILSKSCTLAQILNSRELQDLQNKAEKNNWSEDTILNYVYTNIKENISDYLNSSDFLDSSVIIETDPYIIKAMELMRISQCHAGVLLVEKEYRYPGSWVNDIAEALKNLNCNSADYNLLVWDAYYIRNYEQNSKVEGWKELVEVLEDYYDTL